MDNTTSPQLRPHMKSIAFEIHVEVYSNIFSSIIFESMTVIEISWFLVIL